MLGVLVNTLTVIIGSLLGLLLGNRLREEWKDVVLASAGIVTFILGIQMGLTTQSVVVILLALIAGGVTGHLLGVERGILNLGDRLKRLTKDRGGEGFAHGFLSATVLFCVGAMTIIGSFRSGTTGDHSVLFVKSALDGFLAVILTSTLGIGVLFSCLAIFFYQGLLVLTSAWLQPLVDERLLTEIGAWGGLLIIFIGLDLLKLRKVPVADFLPGMVFVVLFVRLEGLFQTWLGN